MRGSATLCLLLDEVSARARRGQNPSPWLSRSWGSATRSPRSSIRASPISCFRRPVRGRDREGGEPVPPRGGWYANRNYPVDDPRRGLAGRGRPPHRDPLRASSGHATIEPHRRPTTSPSIGCEQARSTRPRPGAPQPGRSMRGHGEGSTGSTSSSGADTGRARELGETAALMPRSPGHEFGDTTASSRRPGRAAPSLPLPSAGRTARTRRYLPRGRPLELPLLATAPGRCSSPGSPRSACSPISILCFAPCARFCSGRPTFLQRRRPSPRGTLASCDRVWMRIEFVCVPRMPGSWVRWCVARPRIHRSNPGGPSPRPRDRHQLAPDRFRTR